jgi:hypothetical protein
MITASAEFTELVQTSHTIAARAEIFQGSELYDETYYLHQYFYLEASKTSVSYVRNSQVRSTCTIGLVTDIPEALEVVDPLLVPEIQLYCGIQLASGEFEWISMGVFCIESRSVKRTGSRLYISLSGSDRSRRIAMNKWKNIYQVTSGTNVGTAINDILVDREQGFFTQLLQDGTAEVTPQLVYTQDDDPFDAAYNLAEGIGCELYADRYGAFICQDVLDPTQYHEDVKLDVSETGFFTTPPETSRNTTDVFNGVICRGEAPWLLFPIVGEAWDDDGSSLTYRLGPMGERPFVMGDANITSQSQADAAASAKFLRIKGATETIKFEMMADPRLEPGDTALLFDEVLDISGKYLIDSIDMTLDGSTMSMGLKRRVT